MLPFVDCSWIVHGAAVPGTPSAPAAGAAAALLLMSHQSSRVYIILHEDRNQEVGIHQTPGRPDTPTFGRSIRPTKETSARVQRKVSAFSGNMLTLCKP